MSEFLLSCTRSQVGSFIDLRVCVLYLVTVGTISNSIYRKTYDRQIVSFAKGPKVRYVQQKVRSKNIETPYGALKSETQIQQKDWR